MPVAQRADPQLRAREVLEDRDRAPGAARRGAHPLGGLGVLVEVAVRVVQARDVHPGLDEAGEHLGLARGGADRGDDLRAAHCGAPPYAGWRRRSVAVTARHVGEVLCAVLAQALAKPCALLGEATRSRASSSRWRVIGGGARDRPADREALEEELDGAVPGVLAAGARRRGPRRCATRA